MKTAMKTRREFLQKGLMLVAATSTVPAFLEQTVWAIANPLDMSRTQQPGGKDGRILVVVQLAGGNDGLNTVIPHGDDNYYRARPGLGIGAREVWKIDDYLGLHANLRPLQKLYENSQMSIVQGVGYPNPNRSHFRAMDIWHTAEPANEVATSGWLGRYFDNTCAGLEPQVGISIGGELPLGMRGAQFTPVSFERPGNFRYKGPDRRRYEALNAIQPTNPPQTKPSKETAVGPLQFIERTAMDAQVASDHILKITERYATTAEYPGDEFGQGLRSIAAMIAGGLSTRIYYVSLGGFDTHANQRGRHEQLMQRLAQGVSAFWSDMKAHGNEDRVLMMTFSEFGRRVRQNASGGTDHGAAAPMFVFSGKLKSPIVGKHPSLRDLDSGDLRHGIDFRSVYATILQSWLATPSAPILGQQFKMLPLLG